MILTSNKVFREKLAHSRQYKSPNGKILKSFLYPLNKIFNIKNTIN